jgi:hypothetical protein
MVIAGNSYLAGHARKFNTNVEILATGLCLDEYINGRKLSNISLVKIDVEGFELPVLKGASGFFEASKNNLPAIVVEITNWAYHLLGSSLGELGDFMKSYGYKAYCLFGKHRFDISKMQEEKEKVSTDILFRT